MLINCLSVSKLLTVGMNVRGNEANCKKLKRSFSTPRVKALRNLFVLKIELFGVFPLVFVLLVGSVLCCAGHWFPHALQRAKVPVRRDNCELAALWFSYRRKAENYWALMLKYVSCANNKWTMKGFFLISPPAWMVEGNVVQTKSQLRSLVQEMCQINKDTTQSHSGEWEKNFKLQFLLTLHAELHT